jgi:transcriptional antiterminator RfaH
MNMETAYATPFWYAIHTKPRQEERADSNLRAWKVETYAPKIRARVPSSLSGKATYIIKPLFPGYIFARFVVNDLMHKICYTRGITRILSSEGRPIPIDDEIIASIKSQEEDSYIKLKDGFKSGDKIMIDSGPLRHLTGIFERDSKEHTRIRVLLSAINYQGHLLISSEMVSRMC